MLLSVGYPSSALSVGERARSLWNFHSRTGRFYFIIAYFPEKSMTLPKIFVWFSDFLFDFCAGYAMIQAEAKTSRGRNPGSAENIP